MQERFEVDGDVPESVYYDMLGAVPPERMSRGAFLVGEPVDFNSDGHERYEMFYMEGEKYFYGGLCTVSWFDRTHSTV